MSVDSRAFRLALLTSAAAVVSACGGGSSSSSSPPPPPPTANVAAMIVDGGPVVNGMPIGTINQGYVTITVCVPGTSTCQNIDHVWVDTGSAGLRLITSAFTSQLPASMQGTDTVANCVQFVSSYSWGAVRTADVKISGESAASVPIQVIGDSTVPATAPTSCSNGTSALNTAAQSVQMASPLSTAAMFEAPGGRMKATKELHTTIASFNGHPTAIKIGGMPIPISGPPSRMTRVGSPPVCESITLMRSKFGIRALYEPRTQIIRAANAESFD